MADVLPDIVRLQTRKANFSSFVVAAMRADTAALQQLLSGRDPEIAAYVDLGWLRQRWEREPLPEPMSPFWGALWRAAIGQAWLRFGADPAGLAEFIGDPAIAPPRADIVTFTQV